LRKPIKFDLKQVEGLAAQGLTEGQIADALGITQNTLTNHKKRNLEFLDAIKRGQAKGIGVVTNKLMEQIKSGNTTAMIFYLKCRAGWKEKTEESSNDALTAALEILVEKLPS
jgi:DNA-binding CsgD family transcriptional regulator